MAPALTLMFVLTCLLGFVVFAYYHTKGCDPLRSGKISNSNQVRILRRDSLVFDV